MAAEWTSEGSRFPWSGGGAYRLAATATAGVLGLTGLVVLLTIALLDPPAGDLAALSAFLITFGVGALGAAFLVRRNGLPSIFGTLRQRMVLVAVATAVISLANVGFIAALMFLSTHDLALLTGLLLFSGALSAGGCGW